MKNITSKIIALSLLVLSLFSSKIYSQCTVGCDVTISTYTPVTSYTIPANQTYCVVAGGHLASSGNLFINGTLRLCGGTITRNSGNIQFGQNGKMQIFQGANAVINGRIIGATAKIEIHSCPMPDVTLGATIGFGGPVIQCSDISTNPALPIKLLYFKGHITPNNTSLLTWATSSEKNNDYFSIEYADDGLEFAEIAQVKGQGDSKEEVKYQYEDTYFRSGKGYYRLRQIDFDGEFSYSPVIMLTPVITLTRSHDSNGLLVYPNPIKDKLHIRTEYDIDNSSITLMDGSGRKITTVATINQGVSTLSTTTELSPGIYYLKIVNATNEVKQYKIG